MVTIKEIAKELSLSSTTVSNVIHGKSREVSPETVCRVQEALDAHGYVPNIVARNLAQNESKIIGVALKARPDQAGKLIEDPYVSVLIGAIENAVRKRGYFMMVYISEDSDEIIRHARSWNADGLILVGMLRRENIRIDGEFRKPMVCIDLYDEEGLSRFVNIGLEDEKGGYLATRHLLDLGHRRIAFLSDGLEEVDSARFSGYRKALKEAGVAFFEEDFLRLCPWEDKRGASFEEICQRLGDYTAVFCVSDLYAVLLMAELADRGIRVPEDLSVVGFDDILLGRLHRPALTTVHQDISEKGTLAVSTLVGILGGSQPERQDRRLPVRLVERESTARPRAGA